VNRIQNRRKEMDLQITDRIKISIKGLSVYADLADAIEKHKSYILEETQGLELSTSGENGGGEWFDANIEGCEIQISTLPAWNI
jgi:hypothetical protein